MPTQIDCARDSLRRFWMFAGKAATLALMADLDEEDRYVRGNSVHALYRIDTTDTRDALLRHLMAARYCDTTTADSLY